MNALPVPPATSRPREISENEFWDRFKPIRNPRMPNGSWNGCMYETSGRDLAAVQDALQREPLTVWTILDCDGVLVVASGFHYVNRLGYLITEVPVEEGIDYKVVDEESDLDPAADGI